MARPRYMHKPCPVCRCGQNFKVLDERDVKGRTLMVCTRCNGKTPVPGQRNPTWAELLADDDQHPQPRRRSS